MYLTAGQIGFFPPPLCQYMSCSSVSLDSLDFESTFKFDVECTLVVIKLKNIDKRIGKDVPVNHLLKPYSVQ